MVMEKVVQATGHFGVGLVEEKLVFLRYLENIMKEIEIRLVTPDEIYCKPSTLYSTKVEIETDDVGEMYVNISFSDQTCSSSGSRSQG